MTTKLTITIPVWLDRICAWPVVVYHKHKYGKAFRKIYLGENDFTIVDPDVYYRLGNFKWVINGNGTSLYAIRHIKVGPKKTIIRSLHREIMNSPAGLFVDHRNCYSLDNTRSNLRAATNSQNQCNRSKTRSNTSSRFIGVSFNKNRKKWLAYISYERKRTWLGAFDNEIDAARAYDAAARKYHKDFARLNFPSES